MALSYSDIEVELREISLRDRPQSLYDVSSKGTVPVIITNDNLVIDESLDIMAWSLNQNKNQTWLVDDSDPSYYGQVKWAVMKNNSWTGKRKEDTRYANRRDWFKRYMKGYEIDYSPDGNTHRTGKFRVGVNYWSNAEILSKIPPKELQRLIDEYKQEQEEVDKAHEAWKKERDSRLKHTIDSMK